MEKVFDIFLRLFFKSLILDKKNKDIVKPQSLGLTGRTLSDYQISVLSNMALRILTQARDKGDNISEQEALKLAAEENKRIFLKMPTL